MTLDKDFSKFLKELEKVLCEAFKPKEVRDSKGLLVDA